MEEEDAGTADAAALEAATVPSEAVNVELLEADGADELKDGSVPITASVATGVMLGDPPEPVGPATIPTKLPVALE